jgi:acetoin utilization protein AcuC
MNDSTCRACVVYDESLTSYDFGPTHPMNPVRVDLTISLAQQLGVLKQLTQVPAPDATEDDLETVHSPALIEAVMAASADPTHANLALGLGSEDNPTFANMHQAARHVVGASVEAARQLWTGQADHAANIAGGLHHAMPDRASGFCVYNDVAIAIRWLLAQGAQKIAYVDVDVHHGDGVERIFYNDRTDALPRHRLPGRCGRT